jgi:prefoldin subunit 5
MTNPIIVETDLKDILKGFGDKLERIEQKLDVLPKVETETTQLRADVTDLKKIEQKLSVLPKIETEINQLRADVADLKSNQRYQIWALIVLLNGAFVKFGFFPNP